jgi:hypothetical protein
VIPTTFDFPEFLETGGPICGLRGDAAKSVELCQKLSPISQMSLPLAQIPANNVTAETRRDWLVAHGAIFTRGEMAEWLKALVC